MKEAYYSLTDKIYATDVISSEDEFDRLKKVLMIYSCHKRIKGECTVVLKGKLLFLLAIYIKYGYNKEAKEKACKIFGVKIGAINSYNLELRKLGYLLLDKYNKRISHLHPDLKKLNSYVADNSSKDLFMLIKFKNV